MDSPTFASLVSETGRQLIAEVSEINPNDMLAAGTRLRASHAPELVAAAMTQAELRRRAVGKFGERASLMFFTRDALEQATRSSVAAHRARRLACQGASAVTDLGCGIGADLIAFADAGLRVTGVEIDPVRAAMAEANLAACGHSGTVICADAATIAVESDSVIFTDPARRQGDRRVFSTAGLTPPWDFVTTTLEGAAVSKVMPGIGHHEIPAHVEAEWVSEHGSLVEACLWGRSFAGAQRRATVLPSGASMYSRHTEAVVGDVNDMLLEPDDAVIRAGLVAELAEDVGGHLIDEHIAWISAPAIGKTVFGRRFQVLEELPTQPKSLRAALRARDVGPLTIKKRGVNIDPDSFIRKLRLTGSKSATVVMTRVANKGRAYLVDPLDGRATNPR